MGSMFSPGNVVAGFTPLFFAGNFSVLYGDNGVILRTPKVLADSGSIICYYGDFHDCLLLIFLLSIRVEFGLEEMCYLPPVIPFQPVSFVFQAHGLISRFISRNKAATPSNLLSSAGGRCDRLGISGFYLLPGF
jgi:hypothetical protein